MLDEEDGDALVADGEDQLFGGARLLGVHAGGGLVQEEQAGLGGEGAGDLQLALFAVGEVAGEVVALGFEADELEEFHGAFLAGLLRLLEAGAAQQCRPEAFLGSRVAADEDVLEDRHVGEQADVLEGAGDAGLGHQVGLGREDGALVGDRAFRGDVQAGEAVEEGGLAGAVGADEADDLAGVDGEVDRADGGEAAEAHGDVAGFEYRCRHDAHAPALVTAAGWPDSVVCSGMSSWPVSWNSSWLRRLAMMPSGRKRISRMRAMPKASSDLSWRKTSFSGRR